MESPFNPNKFTESSILTTQNPQESTTSFEGEVTRSLYKTIRLTTSTKIPNDSSTPNEPSSTTNKGGCNYKFTSSLT